MPDGRYPHAAQVHERLSFLRFLLKDGHLWLCAEQVMVISHISKWFNLHSVYNIFNWLNTIIGEANMDVLS